MPTQKEVKDWVDLISSRYRNYLTTSFYFKDEELSASFERALKKEECDESPLYKGPISEPAHGFKSGKSAQTLAAEYFPQQHKELCSALIELPLHQHQEEAIHQTHIAQNNIVVATGTASGKTEGFLYPILFHLYQQYLNGALDDGVRALILYPMNALANDQRRRMGEICAALKESGSGFKPTFGQYIGTTPYNDKAKSAPWHENQRLANEKIYREEMRQKPPHILLTNYSMLEYLLIRPEDSELFDDEQSKHWKFLVLDEAHQYRGAKGMEMGMLVRRLKQRLRDGGRKEPFRCIATSATISSGESEDDKNAVANFAQELFDEDFGADNVIFASKKQPSNDGEAQRFHFFMRALEGAFLTYKDGKDVIALNRKKSADEGVSLEIALCRECGQHYYVGRNEKGFLLEANRDPGGKVCAEFYMPSKDGSMNLCRKCGRISDNELSCTCEAGILVKYCKEEKDKKNHDQLKECASCGYTRGRWGDPVQEIVRGADGPNSVIVTALHELMSQRQNPDGKTISKILSFADSRQEAAFFAWYAEKSFEEIHVRNFILRAINSQNEVSLNSLQHYLIREMEQSRVFPISADENEKAQKAWHMIFDELFTEDQRISLSGVGLVEWSVLIPKALELESIKNDMPSDFSDDEIRRLLSFLLDSLRRRRAMELLGGDNSPRMKLFRPQQSVCIDKPGKLKYVFSWTGARTINAFLHRLFNQASDENPSKFLESVWDAINDHDSKVVVDDDKILWADGNNGTFRLNPRLIRARELSRENADNRILECGKCARITTHNIRGICPRLGCDGNLCPANMENLSRNHYRNLYQVTNMPPKLLAEEHTAQVDSKEAWQRQKKFKEGSIHLLSTSTTFEVGVDLGDLETVFLRNVPPEPFNYTQRIGRAGRREHEPGFALTYCRRNPHDLYHYHNPEERILHGKVSAPQLRMQNEKIIRRHMTAVVLSEFFRHSEDGPQRFKYFCNFIGCPHNPKKLWGACQNCESWANPRAVNDLRLFCAEHKTKIEKLLCKIVPSEMHKRMELYGNERGGWLDAICGEESKFSKAEQEVCHDYRQLREAYQRLKNEDKINEAGRFQERMKTIAGESTLNFLSRKAIIPKYGFPVDVVELDVGMSCSPEAKKLSLQRDLSRAIAEYAPGSVVIANKKEWKSIGFKLDVGKNPPIRGYIRNGPEFQQKNPNEANVKKYLWPTFGFVTKFGVPPVEPSGRPRRLYTTRPFFVGFHLEPQTQSIEPQTQSIFGIEVTESHPGTMVVLCEGHNGSGFYLCEKCGFGSPERTTAHQTPYGSPCGEPLGKFALGHEFVTDVVHIRIPGRLTGEWDAYSLAYAILLGAARVLNVSDNDLSVTVTKYKTSDYAIVLYDNVPGGAGLVASLKKPAILQDALANAQSRVSGECGCDSSCYGCLRSYRNQFAHTELDRNIAFGILSDILKNAE